MSVPKISQPQKAIPPINAGTEGDDLVAAVNDRLRRIQMPAAPPAPVPQITFLINDGTPGVDVAPVLRCPDQRTLSKCVLTVKASDSGIHLAFMINRHRGATVAVFTASNIVAAGAALYQQFTFRNLAAAQEDVIPDDKFTIDISSGSSAWMFTVSLE